MTIKGNFEPIKDISQIQNLRKTVGWRERSIDKWKEVIKKSSLIYYLYDNEDLIGMGRTVDDGVMCMIYDVVVKPEYQNKSFGKKIVKELLKNIEAYEEYIRIGLFAFEDPDLINFYESFGFEKDYGMMMTKYKN